MRDTTFSVCNWQGNGWICFWNNVQRGINFPFCQDQQFSYIHFHLVPLLCYIFARGGKGYKHDYDYSSFLTWNWTGDTSRWVIGDQVVKLNLGTIRIRNLQFLSLLGKLVAIACVISAFYATTFLHSLIPFDGQLTGFGQFQLKPNEIKCRSEVLSAGLIYLLY